MVLGIVFLITLGGSLEAFANGRIYPRVHVAGVDVGGQTETAAAQLLYPTSLVQRFRPIVLLAPQTAPITISVALFGYISDNFQSAKMAYAVGRTGSIPQRAVDQLKTIVVGADLRMSQRLDHRVLRRYLIKLAFEMNRAPLPGQPGRQLDINLAQRRLVPRLLQPGVARVRLPFIIVPARPKRVLHYWGYVGFKHHIAAHQ